MSPLARALAAVVATCCLVVGGSAISAASDTAPAASPTATAPPATEFENLDGLPLSAVTAAGSDVGYGPDGEPWMYFVSSGSTAVLSVVRADTGERVHEFPLPGAGGSWAVEVVPNGDVYIGAYGNGHLYRWQPGAATVDDLGAPIEGETFIWSLTHAADGTVYGGTGQFGGHIFRYDPVTGDFTDYGPTSTGEQVLVRALATSADGRVFALGAMAPFFLELDPETGEYTRHDLPPGANPEYAGYDLDIRGSLLFARFSPAGGPTPLFVQDLETGEWIDEISGAHGLNLSDLSADGSSFYFVKDGELFRYDMATRSYEGTGFTGLSDQRAFGWLDIDVEGFGENTLVGSDFRGNYFLYNPETGKSERVKADAVGAPAPIRAITEGPDGKVYAGSFLNGGLASYDPETGEKVSFAGELGQAEGMTTHDGMLYIGTYPGGDIYRYDPSKPAERGKNPEHVLKLREEHQQSRPFAMVSAGRYLAIGTVPENGHFGGGLTLLDTETDEWTFQEIVPGHSVVGLLHFDGVLYGTTSVYGGAGAPRPTEKDAVVFAYDLKKQRMLWQTRPLPGEGAFGQLALDADGDLWTHSPVTVMRMDPKKGTLLESRTYQDYPWDKIEYAHVGSRLWIDPYFGSVAAVAEAAMWLIDPGTLERARYVRPISQGFLHSSGSAYLSRDLLFSRLNFLDGRSTPTVEVVPVGGRYEARLSGFGPGELVEIWLRPDARQIATINVDADGSARVTVAPPRNPGEYRLSVDRPATRGQLFAEFTVD